MLLEREYSHGVIDTAIGLHKTALHCTALHCMALHCTALKSTALHYTLLHCIRASIRIGWEIRCLPYAGFFLYILKYENIFEVRSVQPLGRKLGGDRAKQPNLLLLFCPLVYIIFCCWFEIKSGTLGFNIGCYWYSH